MKTELAYLVWVTVLTGLMWIPYILDRLAVWGLTETVGYPENPKPQSAWARRMMKAHVNAIENLVVFAVLVLAAQDANSPRAARSSRGSSFSRISASRLATAAAPSPPNQNAERSLRRAASSGSRPNQNSRTSWARCMRAAC